MSGGIGAYRDAEEKKWVPCGTCMYLMDNKICAFSRCIRLGGWKAVKDGKLESK